MATNGTTTSSSLAEVDRLLSRLSRNLEEARLSLQQQQNLLEQIKVYGRNPATATPIFRKSSINTLATYGLDHGANSTSREALRCLANAFLLNEPSRQIFVDLELAPKAAERLKSEDVDDEFLCSRMLFLLTYGTTCDLRKLVETHALAERINGHVARHANNASKGGVRSTAQQPGVITEEMAMTETLKLLFNITYHYPDLIPRFAPAVEPLIELLLHTPIPSPPLQAPVSQILNALLNLDLQAAEESKVQAEESKASPLFPESEPECVLDRMISIFDSALKAYPETELDTTAAPLCTLLRRAYELANPEMKAWMRSMLLPRPEDRDQPLGKGETLSARLLRASSSPNLPTLRDNISSLLFELSDKDANKFVQNIGYGFASGFLMSQGVPIPQNTNASASSTSATSGAEDVNPVTGQTLNAEDRDRERGGREELPEMTEEEKEREAERLFVLFERLRATGVVDVENPVTRSMREREEGRFEEVDD